MQPKAITDADVAFGGSVRDLMPDYAAIPEDFRHGRTQYNRLASQWFFRGLQKSALKAKDGIDARAAFRHLSAIQGSWEPKHEHKEAAVAYLMSLWFDIA